MQDEINLTLYLVIFGAAVGVSLIGMFRSWRKGRAARLDPARAYRIDFVVDAPNESIAREVAAVLAPLGLEPEARPLYAPGALDDDDVDPAERDRWECIGRTTMPGDPRRIRRLEDAVRAAAQRVGADSVYHAVMDDDVS